MKFDFVIGNPPYQDETIGDNKTYAAPVYDKFLTESYKLAEVVEMIHPARFLFDAGSTPKEWNRNMLNDKHIKVLYYDADSSNVFSNTDIKGGVAITYRDLKKDFGEIKHFVVFEELRGIIKKAAADSNNGLDKLIYASESYRFNDKMHQDYPKIEAMLSKGHKYDFKTSVLEKLDNTIFFAEKPDDTAEYVKILGLVKGKRCEKWIRREYISVPDNFEKYKVFVPAANGSGALGEVISTPLIGQPLIGQPLIGHTQTFISIGCYDTSEEADNLLKYIKGKFCRVLLGVLKVTQHNPGLKWRMIPIQDFTKHSDINWSASIPNIDKQLYKKYNLSDEEINFIESKVKEMA